MENKELYRDNDFVVYMQGKYVNVDFLTELKGEDSFKQNFYFGDMEEFINFKDKFNEVRDVVKLLTTDYEFIIAKNIKYIECCACPIDIRYKLTNSEVAEKLFNIYQENYEKAIIRVKELVTRRDELNSREEAEITNLIANFNLIEYQQYSGYINFNKCSDDLKKCMDNILEELKKLKA